MTAQSSSVIWLLLLEMYTFLNIKIVFLRVWMNAGVYVLTALLFRMLTLAYFYFIFKYIVHVFTNNSGECVM